MNLFPTLALVAVVMLTAGCDKKAEEPNPPKSAEKLPNTKGLPLTTNLYAQVDLKLDPQNKQAYGALFDSFIKVAEAEAEGRAFLRKAEDAIGRLNDAGFGDFAKGDLNSITFGMTLPDSPVGFEAFSPEEADITLILRGKFSPERTKAFCQAERIPESLVGGQTAWNLGSLIDKLTGEATLGGLPEDEALWFAHSDSGTIAIGTRGSLRKILSALKGERPSLQPSQIKAAEDFRDWNIYLCFSNPRLIEAAAALSKGNAPSDKIAKRIVLVMPHDHALLVSGIRGDSEAMAIILSNASTQESIQYSFSASRSLTRKLLDIYSEGMAEILDESRGPSNKSRDAKFASTAKMFVNSTLEAPLMSYRSHLGDYPSTEEGLRALVSAPDGKSDRWRGPYVRSMNGKLPSDPWGEPYQYRYPGFKNPESYDLFSKGPDRKANTADDIGNW